MRCCTERWVASRVLAVFRVRESVVALLAAISIASGAPGDAPLGPPDQNVSRLTEEQCRLIAIRLGDAGDRASALEELKAHPFFSARVWVNLLGDPDLATRLGALEVLEERAGSDLDFDPWDQDPVRRQEAWKRWDKWAEGGGRSAAPVGQAALGEGALQSYLRDIMSGNVDKAERAVGKLQPFSRQAIGAIESYLVSQPSLVEGFRARLKEAQYRLLLDSAALPGGKRIARQLATGNRDEKVEGLDQLTTARVVVLPIVGEILRDEDPLVRERAMDVLLSIGGAGAIPLAEAHLRQDDDPNVAHAAIRAFGKIEGASSVRALLPYLKGDDEDQVSAALQSLSLLGDPARSAKSAVEPCLGHLSWRVRAAAANFVTKTRASGLEEPLIALLDDEDSFVRSTAVQALAVSEKSFSSKVESALVAAARKYPDMQGPVFRACRNSQKPIPAALLDGLAKASPEVRMDAMQALSPSSDRERRLIEEAAESDNPDLAGAALRTLAKYPDTSDQTRRLVIQALSGESIEKRSVVLDHLNWKGTKVTSRSAWSAAVEALLGSAPSSPERPSASSPGSAVQDELMSAFGLGAADPKPAPAEDSGKKVDSLLDAFGVGPDSPAPAPATTDTVDQLSAAFFGAEAASPPAAGSGSIGSVEDALAGLAAVPDLAATDEAARDGRRAALLLIRGGSPKAVAKLVETLPRLDVQDRADIAEALDYQPHPGFIPLWRGLLRDPSDEVRQRAFRAALDDDYPVLAEFALREGISPDSLMVAPDLYSRQLEYLCENDGTKKVMAGVARALVEEDRAAAAQVLGLILLRSLESKADSQLIGEKLESPDYGVRRAAVMALGAGSQKSIEERIPQLARDQSAWVREAAAASVSRDLRVWKHYFSDTREVEDERYDSGYSFDPFASSLFSTRPSQDSLDPGTVEALRRLTGDVSDRVRIAAWMALLANREEIDVAAVSDLIVRSPDRESWGKKLADHFEKHQRELGPALGPLLAHIDRKQIDPSALAALEGRFGLRSGEATPRLDFGGYLDAVASPAGQTGESGPADQFVEADAADSAMRAEVRQDGRVVLFFFFNPGCHECDQTREDIRALRERYPGLVVNEHNIRDTSAVILNEALCSRFGVDPGLRQVTPAVFLQEGALIKSDLSRPAIDALIRGVLATGETDAWHQAADDDLVEARETVESRFATLGLAGVSLAGLLDGINPCAFATIIFLLSYLQVTRRNSAQILAIGGAFIAGVFIAYFVLGLGLVELVGRLQAFRVAGQVLNVLLAIACLGVAWLSFRDARLARAGQLSEMSLQLPGFLKERIRRVIRTGARSSRFVAAAFISGVVISVLELACTGQVYLPTIVYAMKTGSDRAIWFLLLYNLAFIVPLIVVFVLAWRGLKSDALIRFQERHTAGVKTALGWLFVFLFLTLLWSGRLL